MTKTVVSGTPEKKSIGGEMVIPVCALVFTLYYFSTIIDSPWTAQVSAFFVGAILITLVLIFFVKSLAGVLRGEADLGLGGLISRTDVTSGRIWFFVITLTYIVVIEWAGFTLTTFGFLFSTILILNKGQRPGFIALFCAGIALAGYALFILVLETRLPFGPFENFIQSVM